MKAANDTCVVLQALVYTATPKAKLPQAQLFLKMVGLDNCSVYAHKVIDGSNTTSVPALRRNK